MSEKQIVLWATTLVVIIFFALLIISVIYRRREKKFKMVEKVEMAHIVLFKEKAQETIDLMMTEGITKEQCQKKIRELGEILENWPPIIGDIDLKESAENRFFQIQVLFLQLFR
jgi:hypothetical protein